MNQYSVYFDLETGGLADDSPIIQLAAVAINDTTWEEIAAFERKLKFDESKADQEALKLNHYDPQVWADRGLMARQVCVEFAAFIQPYASIRMVSKRTGMPYGVARLIGHNAATFDGPRLKQLFQINQIFLPADPRVRCTVQAAMWWFDSRGLQPENFKLGTLCQYFEIPVPEDQHDALCDVRLNVQLAKKLRGTVAVAA